MPSSVADPPQDLCERMRGLIRDALPGAEVRVAATSPGHFEVAVTSSAFEGKGVVDQQRLVYGAIAPLMRGDAAPVHAIDRMTTRTP